MHKARSTSFTFNPEKFLAKDAKKTGTAHRRQQKPLRPIVVLTDDFKAALYEQVKKERPEFFREAADIKVHLEAADFLKDFLRHSLAKEQFKFSDHVFRVLYFDFLRGLAPLFSNWK